jgi:hypothetical protein
VVRQYAAREAIATSSGQNDSGLFELNFRDERYLPFEFHGAVSRWRIELPQETNYWPMDTLSDLVLHLNYTAREGGDMLRQAAAQSVREQLPGSGWSLLDVQHDFPDAWELFRSGRREGERPRYLVVRLKRKLFPWIPCHRELWIDKLALVFETEKRVRTGCPATECACPAPKELAGYKIKYTCGGETEREDWERETHIMRCVASEDWDELYYGLIEGHLGPLGDDRGAQEVRFEFPAEMGETPKVYLFCHYRVEQPAGSTCARSSQEVSKISIN